MATIREAGPEDGARLALIAQATFLETFAGSLAGADILAHCSSQLDIASHQAWLADPRARLWLAEAEAGGAPIGYAMLAPPVLPIPLHETDLELKRIYLLSRFHGTGSGRALMHAVIEAARAQGALRLLLGVYAENHRAIAFYRASGFTRVGERRFQVGETPYEDVIFARDLKEVA